MKTEESHLRGIAWNHTRGFTSVVATAQRFEELHPGVRITWEKRSLQAFADAPMEDLARAFDLIIMDHPHTALAAREKLLLPLDDYLSAEFLKDQSVHSVGGSHETYACEGHQWTLAIDAAAPIATWRPDLLEKHGLRLPETWEEMMDLAKGGFASPCLFPIDSLMLLYSLCDALGQAPFTGDAFFAPEEVTVGALDLLRTLASACSPECLERNPIRTAEFMSQSDEPSAAYCPFAYGYSNYSRPGYAPRRLQAGNVITCQEKPLRTTLGGAGIAVSAFTGHPEAATDYARFTAEADIQKGLYFDAGGQPGHTAAWEDDRTNTLSSNFFRNTRNTLERAFKRPPYPGYMWFQDCATPLVHDCVSGQSEIADTVRRLNQLYLDSLKK